jgi:nitroreductase
MDAVLRRRSIRKYTSQAVSEETIRELLEAAMAAPSAGNEQPWHFVVIRDPTLLDQIPTVHPYAKMVRKAPLAIMVCGDLDLAVHGEMWVQDCSAATENLLIAVQAKNLGAVWLGVYPIEERIDGLRKLLEIPERIVPFALVAIGHPDEEKPPSKRYKKSRIHYDVWRKR